MDDVQYDMMKWCLAKCEFDETKRKHVIDIGSMDVNGSHRDIFGAEWVYTGMDIEPGKNVDIVVEPYKYPIIDGSIDLVISGSCLEHVEDLYAWTDEAIRIVKTGGYLCIIVPSVWREHRFPIDCWRIFPDGMRFLFVKRTKNKVKEIFIGNYAEQHGGELCYGVFQKL